MTQDAPTISGEVLAPEAAHDARLRNLLTPELRSRVESGEYEIVGMGQNDKPVVVNADTKRFVKGSGRPLNANDPAWTGKVTAYKRSAAYKDALEQFIPAWKDDSPDAITSLEELVASAKKLATPQKVKMEKECPCGCGESVVFEVDKLPDAKMVMFLIERLAGAATKTENINVRSEEVIALLTDKSLATGLQIVSLTPEQRAENARRIAEA